MFFCLRHKTPYPYFAAGVSLSEAQNPIPPPLHTVVYTCIQYNYSHREEGRGESWTREKVRGATVHKAGSTIPTWLTESPEKHLPQILFTGQFFRWRHFALVSIYLIYPLLATMRYPEIENIFFLQSTLKGGRWTFVCVCRLLFVLLISSLEGSDFLKWFFRDVSEYRRCFVIYKMMMIYDVAVA